jgi:hypothetical protein
MMSQAAIALAVDVFGGLHGVINCAGVAIAEKVLGKRGVHDLGAFTRVLRVNLVGTFNVIRLAVEVMAQSPPDAGGERGVIVNTASVAAYDGQIGQAAYAASKGGVAANDVADCARPGAAGHPRNDDCAWHLRHADAGRAARSGASFSSAASAFSVAPRQSGGICGAGAMHIIENPMLNGEVIRLDGAIRMGPK